VLKTNIENFRALMPLILDLRDEAMRERHWKELKFDLKGDFDETSDDFTLEMIRSLNFQSIADKVAEVADNARKELKIE
jgi:dynein heavy chain